jgi:hypothetical protein
LKERFRIVKVNDDSVFNGNNKLAICQNCQHCRNRGNLESQPLQHGEEDAEDLRNRSAPLPAPSAHPRVTWVTAQA